MSCPKIRQALKEGFGLEKINPPRHSRNLKRRSNFKTQDQQFYITLSEAGAQILLQAVRKHWSIE